MSRPYRSVGDGDIIRADDWNDIQSIIKEEVRTHRHGGGAEGETDPARLGGLLTSRSLRDQAVTAEKVAEDAVSSRVLAPGSIQARHFRPDAAIDESKILFDPDEPAAYAMAKVALRAPDDVTSGFLWAVPAGTPITNNVGDIVFRTTDPVTLSDDQRSVEVTVRCEQVGVAYNVPAGTLTRVGGALDPFLREHITIAQQAPAQGGLDPAEGQAPQTARAPVELRVSPSAPRTFWVIPKGTRVSQPAAGDGAPIAFMTRQSLSIFPGSGWVEAEAVNPGSNGNVAAGTLTRVADPALALQIAIDQPMAAAGGDTGQSARVRLRVRLLGDMPASPLVVAAGTSVNDGANIEFRTLAPLSLHAGGCEHALADPVAPDQGDPAPATPFDIDPETRPRMDKIFDPVLLRYVSARLDEDFEPGNDDPQAVRLVFSFSERAPHVAWQIPAGARVSVGAGSSPGSTEPDRITPLPVFETEEALTLLARAGWVWADAIVQGSEQDLPAGSLHIIDSSTAPPGLIAALEVDQPVDASGGATGNASVLLRFRVIEGAPSAPGQSTWEVPKGTQVSDGNGAVFVTRHSLVIGPGGAGRVNARAELPGEAGNLAAMTLNRVLPETAVRIGNVVDLDTVTPYLSVVQPDPAYGGGEPFKRARAWIELAVSQRAPRTAWLIPRDSRLLRAGGADPLFETIDALPVLPRTGWVWAMPEDPTTSTTIPAHVLSKAVNAPAAFASALEIAQSEAAEQTEAGTRVRVWFRVIDSANPQANNTWTIPAGTTVSNQEDSVRFVTTDVLVLGLGGVAITTAEANRVGLTGNGIADLSALANPEDFERALLVSQTEPAKDGADGGSDGHHHKQELDALPSHPLADNAVAAVQVADGAVSWPKLSEQLAGRLQAIRDQLEAVEDALIEANALEALMKQRHRSAEL